MEKYSKAEKDFVSAFANEIKKDVREAVESEGQAVRNAAKAARVLSNPTQNIPRAIIAYGATKLGQQEIKEDIPIIDLFDFLMREYKEEWIDWLPETIRETVLNGESNELIENKIQAIATCLKTDTPWQEWHIFENVGKAFNHQTPIFGILQPLSPGECWTTMHLMNELRDEDWSNEVLIYVATVMYTNQFVYVPEDSVLAPVQEHMDGFGTDLDLKMKTSEAWSKIKDKDVLDREFNETPVQRQLAKLVMAKEYFRENTEQ